MDLYIRDFYFRKKHWRITAKKYTSFVRRHQDPKGLKDLRGPKVIPDFPDLEDFLEFLEIWVCLIHFIEYLSVCLLYLFNLFHSIIYFLQIHWAVSIQCAFKINFCLLEFIFPLLFLVYFIFHIGNRGFTGMPGQPGKKADKGQLFLIYFWVYQLHFLFIFSRKNVFSFQGRKAFLVRQDQVDFQVCFVTFRFLFLLFISRYRLQNKIYTVKSIFRHPGTTWGKRGPRAPWVRWKRRHTR